jgi:predicted lipoprotein with Yx(FWY)xxD motif
MDQVIREQTCLDACMKANWRTVPADPAARPVGNWSIVPDQDGKPIWSYMGAILFTHTRDRKPGDTMGYGVGVGQGIGGGWRPIPVANLLPAGR